MVNSHYSAKLTPLKELRNLCIEFEGFNISELKDYLVQGSSFCGVLKLILYELV